MRTTYVAIIMALLAQSCIEPDATAPIIKVLEINPIDGPGLVCGEQENHVVEINSNDTLSGQFRLTDDSALSQYKLDLHNNFDCHGHAAKVATTDWIVLNIEDIEGLEQIVNFSLPVPTDVTTGDYHFSIQAADQSGNSAESVIYSLSVSNTSDTEGPVLSVSVPNNSSFSVLKGNPINFQGSVSDNFPLGTSSNGKLEVRYWNLNNQNVNDLYIEGFEISAGTIVNFDFDATVPLTTSDGTYIFEVRSFDAINNPSNTIQFTVEVD
jgi:hypothetical protein